MVESSLIVDKIHLKVLLTGKKSNLLKLKDKELKFEKLVLRILI